MTAGVALDAQKPVFEQAALQVVVELLLDEMRQGCAFGLQPGKKLRVAGLDDTIERRLFRSVAFVDVAVGTAGSKQSSQPASVWVDKAGRRRTTCLSAWAVPGWRRRARFDVGILLTSPSDPDVDAVQALCNDSERSKLAAAERKLGVGATARGDDPGAGLVVPDLVRGTRGPVAPQGRSCASLRCAPERDACVASPRAQPRRPSTDQSPPVATLPLGFMPCNRVD